MTHDAQAAPQDMPAAPAQPLVQERDGSTREAGPATGLLLGTLLSLPLWGLIFALVRLLAG